MGAFLAVAKFVGPPGSIPLLIGCVAAGWAVLRFLPRRRRLAYVWFSGVGAIYIILALPIVANAIAGRLPRAASAEIDSLRPLQSIVLFDGDNRNGRARLTVQLVQSSSTARVIILGEPWLERRLLALGVPADRIDIDIDSKPPTTQAQMEWMWSHSPSQTGARTVVIVSRLQLPRVAALARAHGQPMALVGAPADREPATSGAWTFVPSYAALGISRDAIYELAALIYYQRRGFIDAGFD